MKQPKKVAFAEEVKDKPANLADGQFDEAESHNSFLQALNAWRGVKTEEPAAAAAEPKEKKPGSFFANLGGDSEWHFDCMPTFNEGGTDPIDELSQISKQEPRDSCWQCYKLVPKS